jgi:hypothetical protein
VIVRPNARATVAVPRRIAAGRPIRVSWNNAPGFRRDWVGIWKAGDPDLYNDYLTFVCTGATVAGATTIAGDAKTFPARPLRRAAHEGRRLRGARALLVHRRPALSGLSRCA